MTDESIAARIEQLVAEEHDLRNREQEERSDAGALAAEKERLDAVQVELDRCWDLLRQRRALRSAGGDPDSRRAPRRGHGRALPPVVGGRLAPRAGRACPAAAWRAPRARTAAGPPDGVVRRAAARAAREAGPVVVEPVGGLEARRRRPVASQRQPQLARLGDLVGGVDDAASASGRRDRRSRRRALRSA